MITQLAPTPMNVEWSDKDIRLKNNRLQVTISHPGSAYKGSRFDWSGYITQVTLDGEHSFCVPESIIPGEGTGGIGICGEFGIFTPLRYYNCPIGQQFPKLGVGLLTKADANEYDFAYPFKIQPYVTRVKNEINCIHYSVEPIDCHGYAAHLEKKIFIQENTLSICYQLKNVGTQPIITEEYYHNFVNINGANLGPEYQISFPFAFPDLNNEDTSIINPSSLSWKKELNHTFYRRVFEVPESPNYSWELVHVPSGIKMKEETDFAWGMFAIFATKRLISPECFLQLNVLPNETRTWSRRFLFGTSTDKFVQRGFEVENSFY
jgi:hypothetical protein